MPTTRGCLHDRSSWRTRDAIMMLNFLDALRAAGIPAGIKEHLLLLEALDRDVIGQRPEDFYYLARATYVKDAGLIDRSAERRLGNEFVGTCRSCVSPFH